MRKRKKTILLQDLPILAVKFKEAVYSVMPLLVIILLLCFFVIPINIGILSTFITGIILLIIGIALFTLGTDMAMSPIGESFGSSLTKTNKLWLLMGTTLFVGIIITIAEPDLQVLAGQISGVPKYVLLLAVSIGVGVFLVIALLRILFKIKLSYLLLGFYSIVIILSFFVPDNFLAVAFDSGGVTTGPITVPFIIALGIGVANIRTDKNADNDTFGLVALCSIGPILSVMILGIIFRPLSPANTSISDGIISIQSSMDLSNLFLQSFPKYLKEVGIAIAPIVVFFFIMQIVQLKLSKNRLIKICIGLIYTFLGLVVFLIGANVGLMPTGKYIGHYIGVLPYNWILIPIGGIIGFFIVSAEPAIHVLNKQVFEITLGAIPKKAMSLSLSIGVAISIAIAMARALYGIPLLYFLIPFYAIACLLTFFVPPIFTAVAFDSGGVASGPLTSTFLLSLATGVCSSVNGNIMTDAFGLVALVAIAPLVTIQLLGLYYKIKTMHIKVKSSKTILPSVVVPSAIEEIIEITPTTVEELIELPYDNKKAKEIILSDSTMDALKIDKEAKDSPTKEKSEFKENKQNNEEKITLRNYVSEDATPKEEDTPNE